MSYRRINIYECLGTADSSASSPIKLGVNANIFNHVIVGGYPNDLFPMNVSVQRGVDQVVKLIQQNPGDFVLIGTSQGAMIMSEVFKQVNTWPRSGDCVGVFLFGNPERQAGRAFPGCPSIPTGHGITPASFRLTNTPDLVWEFANQGDPICTSGDDTAGIAATNAFDIFLEQYTGLAKNLPGTLLGLWQTLQGMNSYHNVYGLSTWRPLTGAGTVTVGGVSDNTRSGQQIVIDQLNNVIGPAHADDYTYTTPTFTPPAKNLYITTTTTTTAPQFQDINSLGFGSRIIIPWSLIQPTSTQYAWSMTDTLINNALGASGYVAQAMSTGSNVSLGAPGSALDGVTLSAGSLIFLKDQTVPSQNGVYLWSGPSIALVSKASGPMTCSTRSGAVNAGSVYALSDSGISSLVTGYSAAYLTSGAQPPLIVLAPPEPSWASPIYQFGSQFGAMAAAFATRYQPGGPGISITNAGKGILDYQIWDEPNVIENWVSGVASTQYLLQLKAAYTGIKSVQPSAVVLMGGLQSCIDQRWTQALTVGRVVKGSLNASTVANREPSGFLSEIYGAGGKNYFDIVSYHPPSIGTRQTPKPPGPSTNSMVTSDTIYRVMTANGDSSKKVYWTAIGYDASNYTEQQQCDYMDTLRWLANERAYVGGIAIYGYSD